MVDSIPDYMRGFDLSDDWGFTAVSKELADPNPQPVIDTSILENSNLELAKIKQDVADIKLMMNEIMEIASEKETATSQIQDANILTRFSELEKIILPFLYNLSKSEEPYIHWPNRGPIIKAQIEKILKLTRG